MRHILFLTLKQFVFVLTCEINVRKVGHVLTSEVAGFDAIVAAHGVDVRWVETGEGLVVLAECLIGSVANTSTKTWKHVCSVTSSWLIGRLSSWKTRWLLQSKPSLGHRGRVSSVSGSILLLIEPTDAILLCHRLTHIMHRSCR